MNQTSFNNNDMVVVRYEGPVGGPGMPEMLIHLKNYHFVQRKKYNCRIND